MSEQDTVTVVIGHIRMAGDWVEWGVWLYVAGSPLCASDCVVEIPREQFERWAAAVKEWRSVQSAMESCRRIHCRSEVRP